MTHRVAGRTSGIRSLPEVLSVRSGRIAYLGAQFILAGNKDLLTVRMILCNNAQYEVLTSSCINGSRFVR
jgi:hypothetical protein